MELDEVTERALEKDILTKDEHKRRWIQHHRKYKELDGDDEIVIVTPTEHHRIHQSLDLATKYGLTQEEVTCIVNKAWVRSPGGKKTKAAYQKTPKGRATRAANRRKPKNRAQQLEYQKTNKHRLQFQETISPNIRLSEVIQYNKQTGAVCITSCFGGGNGKKLYRITDVGKGKAAAFEKSFANTLSRLGLLEG